MQRWLACLLLLVIAGCQTSRPTEHEPEHAAMFAPVRMRLHPVFTQVKNWTGSAAPDGVQAELEFQDQFGDAAKASGTAMFELYEYRPYDPDPRGNRMVNPWIATLNNVDDQRLRWNATTSTYTFDLTYAAVSVHKSYVLEATFQDTGGRRLFSRLILQAQEPLVAPSRRLPTSRPAAGPHS